MTSPPFEESQALASTTMLTILLLAALGVCLSLALTPVVSLLARRYGLVDRPDSFRKLHARATPVAGGLVLLCTLTTVLAGAFLVPNPLSEPLHAQARTLAGLLAASLMICLLGVVDDFVSLRGRYKLLGQAAAVVVLMNSGLVVRQVCVFGWEIDLGALAIPFTLFWLLGAINSLNLIDGMDGMLSSVGLIVALALGAMALLGGHWVVACVAFTLVGALAGFLRYNFPPASIFLGDSGSMLVGLIVGTLAIQGSLKGPATVALAAPLAILTVPVFDTAMAILRRKLTGRSLYAADRGHLHHRLLGQGFSTRGALLVVALLSTLAAAGGLVSLVFDNEFLALLTALLVAGIFVLTRLFGHAELVLVRERVATAVGPWFPGHTRQRPQEMQVRLQGCAGWEELWQRLTACAEERNLSAVSLDVNAPALQEGYYASWRSRDEGVESANLWQTEIPLTLRGQVVGRVKIQGREDGESFCAKIAAVAAVTHGFTPAALAGQALPPCPGAPNHRQGPHRSRERAALRAL